MLIRRETPADVDAVEAAHRAASRTDVEAYLLGALRSDVGWVPAVSTFEAWP